MYIIMHADVDRGVRRVRQLVEEMLVGYDYIVASMQETIDELVAERNMRFKNRH